jgi:hypothetical protein
MFGRLKLFQFENRRGLFQPARSDTRQEQCRSEEKEVFAERTYRTTASPARLNEYEERSFHAVRGRVLFA